MHARLAKVGTGRLAIRAKARSGLLELDAVAERVTGMEPPDAGDLAVRADARVTRRAQHGLKPVKVVDEQRGMRLAGRRERLLDTKMQDGGAGREPAAAPHRQ